METDKKATKKKNGRIKTFFVDFKAFIAKGNILDLAIAVVIGGAFGKIVSSLVNDIIMPLITLLAGGKSVADWKIIITDAVVENGVETVAENAIRYGMFLQAVLDFLIIALFIFLALRICMRLKKLSIPKKPAIVENAEGQKAQDEEKPAAAAQAAEAVPAEDKPAAIELLTEIRDLLKNK